MKNLYFKVFMLFTFLICFSANMFAAVPTAKAKTYLNDAKENQGAEKSYAEEKIAAIAPFNFQSRKSIAANVNNLKVHAFKFHLPISYQSLPDRPPKR
ncbi:MAG: hypothetical protein EOO93_01905 [Pedobacter sp.]|nr:MAG: hypothetical protein EOO93_01905 [Pedobacter sp.]